MIVFIIIWVAWFLSELLLNRLLRAGKTDKQDADKGSIRLIWITIGTANTLGILASIFVKMPMSSGITLSYLGLGVIVLGMILRFAAIWSLGKFFTVNVTIREGHRLKQTGMYKMVRHPSYSGSILSFIGFGISLNNWISAVLISVLITWAMLRRISIEEKVLADQFGEPYLDYKKRTYRLLPWIY